MICSSKPSDIHLKNVTLRPLHEPKNYLALQTLLELTKTSIGPHGKLKTIQNVAGGHVSITSCSSRLFHLVSIKNIFLRFISAAVNSHLSHYGNGGLFCALFALLSLKRSLDSPLCDVLVAKLNDHLGKMYVDLLESPENHCSFNISYTNISQLQSVVRSIISSKPGCFFTEENKQDLALVLLKAFIHTIPSEEQSQISRNISFFTEEGLNPSESRLFDGILLRSPMTVNEACITHCVNVTSLKKQIRIALFSTSLAGEAEFPVGTSIESDFSVWDAVLSCLQVIADKLISDNADILLCQRVVHPSVKKRLSDNQVLVIDRLGIEVAHRLQLMTGAVSVSSLSEPFSISYGFCTKFENVILGKNNYFLLQNNASPLWTVFISNFNEEMLAETQTVCKQVIDTLYRLLKDPRICCGAGCTEMYTTHLLKQMVSTKLLELSQEFDCTSNQLLEALQNFTSSLEDSIISIHQKSKLSFVTETACGHLWEIPKNELSSKPYTCNCGKYISTDIEDSQWRPLQNSPSTYMIENTDFLKLSEKRTEGEPKIVDELCIKINALKVSTQVSASLLRLGLSIAP